MHFEQGIDPLRTETWMHFNAAYEPWNLARGYGPYDAALTTNRLLTLDGFINFLGVRNDTRRVGKHRLDFAIHPRTQRSSLHGALFVLLNPSTRAPIAAFEMPLLFFNEIQKSLATGAVIPSERFRLPLVRLSTEELETLRRTDARGRQPWRIDRMHGAFAPGETREFQMYLTGIAEYLACPHPLRTFGRNGVEFALHTIQNANLERETHTAALVVLFEPETRVAMAGMVVNSDIYSRLVRGVNVRRSDLNATNARILPLYLLESLRESSIYG